MDREIMTKADSDMILRAADIVSRAKLYEEGTSPGFDFQVVKVTLPYNTAGLESAPLKINIPWRSLYVMKASHPNLVVKMKPNTSDSFQSAIEIRDAFSMSYEYPVKGMDLFWDAQALVGSTVEQNMYLLLSVSGKFIPGAVIIRGGVKTDLYSSYIKSVLTLSSATATNISDPVAFSQTAGVALGTTERQLLVQNQTGAALYLGNSTVDDGSGGGGVNKGLIIQDGEFFKWNNKQSLYGYSVAGGGVAITIEY